MNPPRYWVGVASHEHVRRGMAGGFCQLCHGKKMPLRRMQRDDWIVYYSPRETQHGNRICQAFTAIGRIADDEPCRFVMTEELTPWRRRVDFLRATVAPIRPLLPDLKFIEDKAHWGYIFRYGHVQIDVADFRLIATAMGVEEECAALRRAPLDEPAFVCW